MELEISSKAKSDLKNIYLYSIKNWNTKHVNQYMFGLENVFKLLIKNPNLGISINEILPNSRIISFRSHLVIYQLNSDTLRIDRVLHKNQLP